MGWWIDVFACALSLFVVLTNAHYLPGHLNHHEPPIGSKSFQRTAVESLPRNDKNFTNIYGSVFLPLRSAVEAIPNHLEIQRQPLRDSVETSLKP